MDNFQIVAFNANFGTIKKILLTHTCYLLFQHQFSSTLKQIMPNQCGTRD
jgi:hypothetical protein